MHPMRLRAYEESPTAAYVELVDYPTENQSGCVIRSVRIDQIITNYDGPKITIDFDANGIAIGIEILYPFEYAQPLREMV